MNKLTYQELELPNYVNSNAAVRLKAKIGNETKIIELTIPDIVYAAEIAGLNTLFVSDTGKGKTQLMTDVAWHHFNGDRNGGKANLVVGRADFEIEDLLVRTQVDLSAGGYDSRTVRQIDPERASRLFFGVDEINRAPKPRQNDFMDLAVGERNFNGANIQLGRDGYSLFMASANLNKLNGDFSGTFELDRALLNRAHLTFDLDHPDFKPTAEDEMIIEERKASPKVDVAKPQDLSAKILAANQEISQKARKLDPYFTAFRFLIGRSLDHCEKDRYKEKGTTFPMLCSDCDYSSQEDNICSLVKASSERTLPAVKSLAYALAYVAELKLGKKVEIDPLDAALQAFKFTTYHGNLNEITAQQDYAARKQIMMDETVGRLSSAVELLKEYVPLMQEGSSEYVKFTLGENETKAPRTKQIIQTLTQKGISYQETDLKTELQAKGLGTDWVDPYIKRMKK
ncbi:MAG: hypothetical protein ABIA37_03655 [Candidatus Woesearchaeota archaeon]